MDAKPEPAKRAEEGAPLEKDKKACCGEKEQASKQGGGCEGGMFLLYHHIGK